LQGVDTNWQDCGTRREAFYTNLVPARYRFRVIACNNDGVWNTTGASLELSIDPAYYQTRWFTALCVAASLGLLAGLYQLRLLYLRRQFNLRLEERVEERMRIARDLHDTMLQSFQAALFKFQAVTCRLTDRPKIQEELDAVIGQARAAVAEG